MKCSVIIVNSLTSILSNIRLSKISDKETKTALLKNYLTLKQIVKKAEETKQELIGKLREDWGEEFIEVGLLRSSNQSLEGHEKFLEAEADTVKLINDVFSEEVEVNLTPVDLDKFVDAVGEEELTLETAAEFLPFR